ncbi:MAG: choice-of-anchor D domain-containing protein, partial [FCB group bacterium]
MKKLLLFLVLLYLPLLCDAQSLSVFNIDTSSFPTIKAKFFAFDASGNQITNLSTSDFQVTENGQIRTVTNVSCQSPKPPQTVSLAMSIDVSGSMAGSGVDIPVELGKTTVRDLINKIASPPSELALQTCHSIAMIINDFTTNKSKLLSEIDPIVAGGDNDFVEQLLNTRTGLLNIAKTGKYKRVAVIYTDAWWYALSANELQRCIDTCKKYNIQFYAVIYSRPEAEPNGIKSSLQALANATGGYLYDGITAKNAADNIAIYLQQQMQGGDPCTIEWQSGVKCTYGTVNIDCKLIPYNFNATANYQTSLSSIAYLDFSPLSIFFKNKPIGVPVDTNFTITARNADFNITNITSSDPNFDINPKSFTIQKGQSQTLTLRYIQPDSNRYFSIFSIENDLCLKKYYSVGGYIKNNTTTKPTLKVTHPNGGEIFVVGSDTLITWEGVLSTDKVKLEYSNDNGNTWNLITDTASGLSYVWKNLPKPVSNQCLVRATQNKGSTSDIPDIEWKKCYGGYNEDIAYSIQETNDGGYIIAGSTESNQDPNVTGFHNYIDAWIVKINSIGTIEWEHCYGGSMEDRATSIKQTSDGGYIFAGYTESNDGDVIGHHGGNTESFDGWVVKLDNTGNLQWQICLGGTWDDNANDVIQTSDGGYIVVGSTQSQDGDFSCCKLYSDDGWIAKLNSGGTLVWQKCLGDFDGGLNAVNNTSDGGFIVAGSADSSIIKFSKSEKIEWQSNLVGEIFMSWAYSIQETSDNGYIIGGLTEDESLVGYHNPNRGDLPADYLVMKINNSGTMEWYKCLGGFDYEFGCYAKETPDGGFIVAGTTPSNDGDVSGNHGGKDYWIVKLNMVGEIEWQRCLGGSEDDEANDIKVTSDGGFIVAGYSRSEDGDVIPTSRFSQGDFWVVKFGPSGGIFQQDASDSVFSIVAPTAVGKNIDMKRCLVGNTKDSVIVDFIKNSGTFPCRIDSIYFSGADASAFQIALGMPPFEVEPANGQNVEFLFKPNRIGIHTAQINILTQSDTLIESITGEGIIQLLSVENKLIDFGKVSIGSNKDTIAVATIKNIGTVSLTIDSTKHNKPNDYDFSTLAGSAPFTLNPGETAKMNLRFKPSDVGRTSGVLDFYYNGVGSPAEVTLFGEGVQGQLASINNIIDFGKVTVGMHKDT